MEHRVDPPEVRYWERLCKETLATAKWTARATWAANNCEEVPFRDTEASQWRAEAFRKETQAKKEAMKAAAAENPGQEAEDEERDVRGHHQVKVLQLSGIRSGWECTLCRNMSSNHELLTSKKRLGCPS